MDAAVMRIAEEFRLFALADLTLERIGERVSREPHRLQREKISPARGLKPVEPEDASIIAGLLQHDAGPGANSEAEECLPSAARREPRDVGRALLLAVKEAAVARGADRVYWHTQQYNGRARSLYDQVGQPTSFVVYEM